VNNVMNKGKIIKIFNQRLSLLLTLFTLILIVLIIVFLIGNKSNQIETPVDAEFPKAVINSSRIIEEKAENQKVKKRFIPGDFTMDIIKKKGCVADGFLSEYGDNTESMIKLINRSNCRYLHRALETWLDPPDFEKAKEIMVQVEKRGIIYGMFIAEAIRKNADYYYPDENRKFDFSEMCREGSENFWGEHSCKPSFEKKEYRKYVRYIIKRAIDIGIQSFLFGQVYWQDESDLEKSELPKIIKELREYSRQQGVQIIIGAQTGYITDDQYLQIFDYVEGGVGINDQGEIENGPCLSWRGGCWALLWHDNYRSRAKNVLLHFDWSGIESDDMSRFARMNKTTREKTLKNLYQYFTSRDMGFLLPLLAPLYRENGGCWGPKKRFYSPDNKYSCKDEEIINSLLGSDPISDFPIY